MIKKHSQRGQIGLIILLIMVVILTIGISTAARTTQQTELTTQQETATRVFNAAEYGIEEALSQIFEAERNDTVPSLPSSLAPTLDGTNSEIAVGLTNDNFLETHLDEGSNAELELNGSGNINISWSQNDCTNNPAAIMVSIIFDDAGTSRAQHYAIDGCAARQTNNNFTLAGAGSSPYNFTYTINAPANSQRMRIQPVYSDTNIQTTGGNIVQAQYTVTSQAQSNAGDNETKSIEVIRTIPSAPSFMSYALVSGTSISK